MHISELISRAHQFIGRETSVVGILLVGADSRLVARAEEPDGPYIRLPHVQTQERLLREVPAWGGGRHIYVEEATVLGVLADCPLRFETVRVLFVRRDGRVYEFANLS